MAEPFLGQVILFGGNYPPSGWATCNGTLLPIRQYTALFSLLGTNYGGDGVNTFGLPDLQGRAPVCFGEGQGLTDYAIGEFAGSETVALLDSQSPSHSHLPNAAQGGNTDVAIGNFWAGDSGGSLQIYGSGTPNTTMSGQAVVGQGGGQPHENRPPYVVINYIISLTGIFPRRP